MDSREEFRDPPSGGVGDDEIGEEGSNTRVIKLVPMPDSKTVEEHNAAGHVPFRAWCKFCVLGTMQR